MDRYLMRIWDNEKNRFWKNDYTKGIEEDLLITAWGQVNMRKQGMMYGSGCFPGRFEKSLFTGVYDKKTWNDLNNKEKLEFYNRASVLSIKKSETGYTSSVNSLEDGKEYWCGTPIFENDIIEFDDTDEMTTWARGKKALVVRKKGRFVVRTAPYDKSTNINENIMTEQMEDCVKVVGNVYQNCDLLGIKRGFLSKPSQTSQTSSKNNTEKENSKYDDFFEETYEEIYKDETGLGKHWKEVRDDKSLHDQAFYDKFGIPHKFSKGKLYYSDDGMYIDDQRTQLRKRFDWEESNMEGVNLPYMKLYTIKEWLELRAKKSEII